MIGSNLVVEGVPGNHHHALAGAGSHPPLHTFSAIHSLNPSVSRSHLMSNTTFAEPYLKNTSSSLLPSPEFAHPLPKPAPIVPRYNGVTSSLNGSIKSRLSSKYSESESPVPVNLVQSKDSSPSDIRSSYGLYTTSRLYPPNPTYPTHFAPPPSMQTGPYGALYPPNPFTPMLQQRDNRSTHLLPLQQYPDSNTPILKSPPTSVGSVAHSVKTIYEPPVVPIVASEASGRGEKRPFKVPSGKEGSLKHRILTRPEARVQKKISRNVNSLLPPPPLSVSSSLCEKNGPTTTSPTDSAQAAALNNANSSSSSCSSTSSISSTGSDCIFTKFNKGSLIKLANGNLKKVEDMRTEDFVSCVQNSSTVRIDPSTVVRIQENALKKGMTTVTLSYGEQCNEVDVETSVEHPYFVVERGWSSYAPNKTLQVYQLPCHQLQVGDVCLTLSPITGAIKRSTSNCNDGGAQHKRNGHRCPSSGVESKAALAAKKNDLRLNSNDGEGVRCSGNNVDNGCHINGNFCANAISGREETKKKMENDSNNNSNNTSDKYEGLSNKKKRRWSAPDQITDEYHSSPLASPPSSSSGSAAVTSKNA